jgi:hypothetical protein
MTQKCPLCGKPNDDEVRFCTFCGNLLILIAGQPMTTTIPPPAQVSPAAQPGQNSIIRIIAIAAIAIIVILAGLYFLQASGTLKFFPPVAPAITLQVTPTAPSNKMRGTSLPETTTPVPVITPDITNVTESSNPPAMTKARVCPSDRHACGANCMDIMTSQDNCGGCNITCASSQVCVQGHCMTGCSVGETSCFDGCHDLLNDAQNCGTCGNTCPGGLECNRSRCSPPLPTVIPTYLG